MANEVPTGLKVVVHGKLREIQEPGLTDAQVASGVRMLMRDSMDHEYICTLARDRILYLSQRLERAEEWVRRLMPPAEAEMGTLDSVRNFLAEPKTKPSAVEALYARP